MSGGIRTSGNTLWQVRHFAAQAELGRGLPRVAGGILDPERYLQEGRGQQHKEVVNESLLEMLSGSPGPTTHMYPLSPGPGWDVTERAPVPPVRNGKNSVCSNDSTPFF